MCIPYSTELLRHALLLTTLVYDYGETLTPHSNLSLAEYVADEKNLSRANTFTRRVVSLLKNRTPHGVVEYFKDDSESDIQVGITRDDTLQRFTVVFRGSESLTDWMYDLNICPHLMSRDVIVHSGFYRQLHDGGIYDDIRNTLRAALLRHPTYTICTTGHSLGGALATLFAYEYSTEYTQPVTVITFGSPKIGNEAFHRSFSTSQHLKHYRVAVSSDTITALPPFYHHVGILITLSDDGIQIQETIPWWRHTVFYSWKFWTHSIQNYNRFLNSLYL